MSDDQQYIDQEDDIRTYDGTNDSALRHITVQARSRMYALPSLTTAGSICVRSSLKAFGMAEWLLGLIKQWMQSFIDHEPSTSSETEPRDENAFKIGIVLLYNIEGQEQEVCKRTIAYVDSGLRFRATGPNPVENAVQARPQGIVSRRFLAEYMPQKLT